MNKDIKILFENENYFYFSFDRESDEYKYVVVGMDNLFNYVNIVETNVNHVKIKKNDLKNFISIRVNYVVRNSSLKKDCVIGFTNDLVINNSSFDKIDVKWIESYNGMTMSFISDIIYDKYYLYEKNGKNYNLICESEDFQVTLDCFKEGNYYYVEAFKKSESGFTLAGVSDKVMCKKFNYVCEGKKLSIVIPVYNCENFLCRCIDSVLLSSFRNIELILVDDGSTDKSSEIIDWYLNKYGDFIKIIHKKNGGVSEARNEGIKWASGEYIAFLDNDDFVHPFMYERFYLAALDNNLDVVIGKVIIKDNVGDYHICLDVKSGDCDVLVYDYDRMLSNRIDNNYDNIFFVGVWNKIIRTSIVKEHLFPKDNYYEDTAFTSMIYSYIDYFGFVKNAYYVWDKRIRNTVGTASNFYSKKYSSFSLHEKYCNSLFYGVYNGNPLKKDYLIYDTFKEVINYIGKLNASKDIINIYKNEIRKVCKNYDINNNSFLQIDKELYNSISSILEV